MDSELLPDGRVGLRVNHDELQALRGGLLEADEAIRDDVAFRARVGVPREVARSLFNEVVIAQRHLT